MNPRLRGFSLVELLVSVAILGLLASIAMPVVELTRKREQETQLRVALRDIRRAIDAYKDAVVQKRIAVEEGASGYPPSLMTLVEGVPDLASKSGAKLYFLRRVPRDPFNTDSGVTAADSWRLRSFASSPASPSAGADVFDVYTTSTGIGLNGIAYSEW
jgi:general secretion pathway protein G